MALDFDSRQYRAASAHQQEWGDRLIAELRLRGHERILDLGCGDGRLTARLAELVPEGHVVGIDSSPGMIAAAREHTGCNVEFRLLDINDMDFDGAFDVLFSNATLHWVEDHRGLLISSYRALRPGGVARYNFAAHGNCAHLVTVLRAVMSEPPYARHFRDFRWPWHMPQIAEYRALVAASPFRESKVWGENADRHFPDRDSMIAWVDQPSLVPFLPHVLERERAAFRDLVVTRMLVATLQPDGQCFETFRRVNLLARRGEPARMPS